MGWLLFALLLAPAFFIASWRQPPGWLASSWLMVVVFLTICWFAGADLAFAGLMLVIAPLVLLPLTGAIVLPYFVYCRARGRGHRAPWALFLVALACAVGMAGAYLLFPAASAWLAIDLHAANPDFSFFSFESFAWWFLVMVDPLLIGAAAAFLLFLIVPVRKSRVHGLRAARLPYRTMGDLVKAASLLAVVPILHDWWTGHLISNGSAISIVLGLMVWGAGSHLSLLGLRLERQQIPEAMLPESVGAIGALYLRPFLEESAYFVYGLSTQYGKFAAPNVWETLVGSPNVGVRFDQFFQHAVAANAGPLVALGNPEDYVPPGGAQRLYAKDSEWTEYLKDLARRANWILVQVGNSQNLRWEFERVRREGWHTNYSSSLLLRVGCSRSCGASISSSRASASRLGRSWGSSLTAWAIGSTPIIRAPVPSYRSVRTAIASFPLKPPKSPRTIFGPSKRMRPAALESRRARRSKALRHRAPRVKALAELLWDKSRPICEARDMSAFPPTPDVLLHCREWSERARNGHHVLPNARASDVAFL